jgi:hypothetical protein
MPSPVPPFHTVVMHRDNARSDARSDQLRAIFARRWRDLVENPTHAGNWCYRALTTNPRPAQPQGQEENI